MGTDRRGYFDLGGNLIDGPQEDVSSAPDIADLPWIRRESWTTAADRAIIRDLLLEFLVARPMVRRWMIIERTRAPVNALSIGEVEPDEYYLVLQITSDCGCFAETSAPFPVGKRNEVGFTEIFGRMAQAIDTLCGLTPLEAAAAVRIFNETPTGAVDGVNADFKPASRYRKGREAVYRNGLRQRSGAGYDYVPVESGGAGTGYDTIRFETAPLVGDWIMIDYELA